LYLDSYSKKWLTKEPKLLLVWVETCLVVRVKHSTTITYTRDCNSPDCSTHHDSVLLTCSHHRRLHIRGQAYDEIEIYPCTIMLALALTLALQHRLCRPFLVTKT